MNPLREFKSMKLKNSVAYVPHRECGTRISNDTLAFWYTSLVNDLFDRLHLHT